MRMQVWSLDLLSGLRIQYCWVSPGMGHRCGSNPKFLWLWCRLAVAALIWPLAWDLPYATGVCPIKQNKNKNKNKNNKCPHVNKVDNFSQFLIPQYSLNILIYVYITYIDVYICCVKVHVFKVDYNLEWKAEFDRMKIKMLLNCSFYKKQTMEYSGSPSMYFIAFIYMILLPRVWLNLIICILTSQKGILA